MAVLGWVMGRVSFPSESLSPIDDEVVGVLQSMGMVVFDDDQFRDSDECAIREYQALDQTALFAIRPVLSGVEVAEVGVGRNRKPLALSLPILEVVPDVQGRETTEKLRLGQL